MSVTHFIKAAIILLLLVVFAFVLSIFDLYTQLARYTDYWQKNNQKPARSNELVYIALGDSTAQGIGATYPSKGYVGLVADELAASRNTPVRTVNLSKSGAKVRDALDTQLPALEKLNPDSKTVITMEMGANDMINFNAADFERDMDKVMSRLPQQTLITDIPYFGGTRFKSKQPNVLVANEIMYRLAKKHGFQLVPLYDRVKQNSGLSTMAVDLFHPSNKAYKENWSKVFMDRLQEKS